MDIKYLYYQLEAWKRWLYICVGASVTLLATAIAETPNMDHKINLGIGDYPGWYGVWMIFQIAITPAGFAILLGGSWRTLPLAERLNPGYGFLGAAWITFLAFGIRSADPSSSSEALGVLILVFAGLLLGSYVWLKRSPVSPTEELFP